jgi:uncharacterized protein (DUF433 family)
VTGLKKPLNEGKRPVVNFVNDMSTAAEIHRIKDVPVIQHPDIVSGAPVFEHTRVPVANLFDYLQDGYTLDEFLESFPSVTREAALQVLHYGQHRLEQELAS